MSNLVIRQLKTNLFDSVRCVKFNCMSFVVAPPEFFEKYGRTSFVPKMGRMQENSMVVVCMPEEGAPDGYACRKIQPKDLHTYQAAWADLVREKMEVAPKTEPAPAKKGSGPMDTSQLPGNQPPADPAGDEE